MPEAGSLAIVIVSFNVRDEVLACLESIERHAAPRLTRIVVVDNDSRDDTVEAVRARWPQVEVIETGNNLGFARACNVGIRATDSEYVLLLNPDTVVGDGAIATLVETLETRPGAAAVGPRVVDAGGRPELSFGWASGGPFGELQQKVIGALYRRRIAPAVRAVERWTRTGGPRPWLTGACLLVRRADLDAAGLLDERYFMYMEDIDLCIALRRRGREVLFVPDATVVHLRGRSVARNPRTEALRRASQIAFYEKHHPRWVPLLRGYLTLTKQTNRQVGR